MADINEALDYSGLQYYHGKVHGEIEEQSSVLDQIESGKMDKSPVAEKTDRMSSPVGVDSNGKLWYTGLDASVAPAYSSAKTYESKDLVIHDGYLYESNQDIDTPEEWTDAHWTRRTFSDAFISSCSIIVTCMTQDGVTVTGQTVTLRHGSDASAPVYDTAAYDGQPVTFEVPVGFEYYVSVSDTLEGHFTPTTASGVANATVSVVLIYSDMSSINTARDIKNALNADVNLADLVGEQITCSKGSDTLTWDVVDYDSANKTVTLLLHDTLPTQMPFDSTQALAWLKDGLPAGDYYFQWGPYDQRYFTLTKDITPGCQLEASPAGFTVYERYDSDIIVETGETSATEITGATNLGATGTDSGLYPLNDFYRIIYGSSNYKECGLRQWLNSDAMPNTQMPQINKLSRPYRVGQAGFLRDLDPDFIAVLDDTVWRCAANQTYEAPASVGGTVLKSTPYTVTDKIGLASVKEISGSCPGTDDGSTEFDLFVEATADDRKKYYNGSARDWWTRSSDRYFSSDEHLITGMEEEIFTDYAYRDYGVVPCCKISKSST